MTKVVAANWKMHHGPQAAARFFQGFRPAAPGAARVAFFPPTVSLAAAIDAGGGSAGRGLGVEFGVQNVHWDAAGALTGELSAEMAREAGATLVLVGHSERRHVFGETDRETGRKVAAAVRAGLTPVVCVGERLEERRAGRLRETLARQLGAVADALPTHSAGARAATSDARPQRARREPGSGVGAEPTMSDAGPQGAHREPGPGAASQPGASGPGFMVAYEPVWAIGTGETATPDDAARAHAIVRAVLEGATPADAERVPVLYGGSVGPKNASALMSAPGVDGVLVGGASLDPASFAQIVDAAPVGA